MRRLLGRVLSLALMIGATAVPAEATHYRGGDSWATIDANGVVHLFVKTRWEKTAFAGLAVGTLGTGNGFPGEYLRIYRIDAFGNGSSSERSS